jgi:hypothetical protein
MKMLKREYATNTLVEDSIESESTVIDNDVSEEDVDNHEEDCVSLVVDCDHSIVASNDYDHDAGDNISSVGGNDDDDYNNNDYHDDGDCYSTGYYSNAYDDYDDYDDNDYDDYD